MWFPSLLFATKKEINPINLLNWLVASYSLDNNVLDDLWNHNWLDNWTSDVVWKIDRWRWFDRSDDFIDLQWNAWVDWWAFTISMWVKPIDVPTSNVRQTLFVTTNSNNNVICRLSYDNDSWIIYIRWFRTKFWVWEDIVQTPSTALPTDTYTHLVLWYDWSDFLRLFVDWILKSNNSGVSWDWTVGQSNETTIWKYGINSFSQWHFGWDIDMVQIWNRELTDGWSSLVWTPATLEVADLYNNWNWRQYPFI